MLKKSLSGSVTKVSGLYFSDETRPTSKFCGNQSSSFSVILLTNTDVSSFNVMSLFCYVLLQIRKYRLDPNRLQQVVSLCLQLLVLSSLHDHHWNHEDLLIVLVVVKVKRQEMCAATRCFPKLCSESFKDGSCCFLNLQLHWHTFPQNVFCLL